MSGRNYKVIVEVKDGGLLKKLDKLNTGSPTGGGGKGSSSGGAMGAAKGMGLAQLAKLTGIGIGVGSLVALTVKSSGVLQGVAKLWESTVMLIFKPIGDFIGFALRPLALMMLMWAIPFYKVAGPWFRDYGRQVGDALVKLSTPEGMQKHIIERTNTTTRDITLGGFGLSQIGAVLTQKILAELSSIDGVLRGVGANLFNMFIGVGQNILTTLAGIPNYFFGVLGSIGTRINDTLLGIPTYIFDVFKGLASSLASTLANIPQMIWNAIMAMFNKATGGIFSGNWGGNNERPSFGTRGRTTTASIADTLE